MYKTCIYSLFPSKNVDYDAATCSLALMQAARFAVHNGLFEPPRNYDCLYSFAVFSRANFEFPLETVAVAGSGYSCWQLVNVVVSSFSNQIFLTVFVEFRYGIISSAGVSSHCWAIWITFERRSSTANIRGS